MAAPAMPAAPADPGCGTMVGAADAGSCRRACAEASPDADASTGTASAAGGAAVGHAVVGGACGAKSAPAGAGDSAGCATGAACSISIMGNTARAGPMEGASDSNSIPAGHGGVGAAGDGATTDGAPSCVAAAPAAAPAAPTAAAGSVACVAVAFGVWSAGPPTGRAASCCAPSCWQGAAPPGCRVPGAWGAAPSCLLACCISGVLKGCVTGRQPCGDKAVLPWHLRQLLPRALMLATLMEPFAGTSCVAQRLANALHVPGAAARLLQRHVVEVLLPAVCLQAARWLAAWDLQ
jgi:hypothetical protein